MPDIKWEQENILLIANEIISVNDDTDEKSLRDKIEPWLTAVFQSEHLSLLCGSGLTTGVCYDAGITPQAMGRITFATAHEEIDSYAQAEASRVGRGAANFEDDLRTALELLKGLKILKDYRSSVLEGEINEQLKVLTENLVKNELRVIENSNKGVKALLLLKKFLLSFASRTATRDRLHIFTTNYDRFIEYALDQAGIYTLDRFVGKIEPIMRMHKMELDYHYNPPGIRGEPRYVEGVVRYSKIHGSLDWRIINGEIHRVPMQFGSTFSHQEESPLDTVVIYPNSAKSIETVYFPYSELFRDFSTSVCRPNSVLVTYGYGFGDSHVNTIIADMLSIPSTHLVIISFDKASGRIPSFVENLNLSQVTLLIGKKLGDLRILTENYLPKSAIDRISGREHELLLKRGKGEMQHSDNILSANSLNLGKTIDA